MAGILYTARMRLKILPRCDYYFLITRYMKKDGRLNYLLNQVANLPGNPVFSHEPSLSPSPELFKVYQDHVGMGTWNEDSFMYFASMFLGEVHYEPMKSSAGFTG